MLLVIDNYDSFTYNLVQYFGELGATMEIRRNDEITIKEIGELSPSKICISPGPCTPKEAGISCDVIKEFGKQIPTLGVCLGHQCIGQVYGGEIIRANNLMHGKTSMVEHNSKGLFEDMPNPFEATRYHSLLINQNDFPNKLQKFVKGESGDSIEVEANNINRRKPSSMGISYCVKYKKNSDFKIKDILTCVPDSCCRG